MQSPGGSYPRIRTPATRATFAEMRRSAWDIASSVANMDIYGIDVSVCFLCFIAGFGGVRLRTTSDDRETVLRVDAGLERLAIEEVGLCAECT